MGISSFIIDSKSFIWQFSIFPDQNIISYHVRAIQSWLTTKGHLLWRLKEWDVLKSSGGPLSDLTHYISLHMTPIVIVWCYSKNRIFSLPNDTKQWYIQERILWVNSQSAKMWRLKVVLRYHNCHLCVCLERGLQLYKRQCPTEKKLECN